MYKTKQNQTGCNVEIYQAPETLPAEVVAKMYGQPQSKFAKEHPIMDHTRIPDLTRADGYVWCFPTRFGMMSAQFKNFLDGTGGLWQSGGLIGKACTTIVSTGTGGGKETTHLTAVTQMAHHGMIYVPVGYSYKALMDTKQVQGGSPYGAGTIAQADGSGKPTETELGHALHQGKYFGGVVQKLVAGTKAMQQK
jgi:NAD(P)H dehydrogenase (quinone)